MKSQQLNHRLEKMQAFFQTLEPGYSNRLKFRSVEDQERLNMTLFDAVCFSDKERVREALSLGADVNYVDVDARATPMHIAVGRQNEAMIQILLDAGASMLIRDKQELTPLDSAWQLARAELNADFAIRIDQAWRKKCAVTRPRPLASAEA